MTIDLAGYDTCDFDVAEGIRVYWYRYNARNGPDEPGPGMGWWQTIEPEIPRTHVNGPDDRVGVVYDYGSGKVAAHRDMGGHEDAPLSRAWILI